MTLEVISQWRKDSQYLKINFAQEPEEILFRHVTALCSLEYIFRCKTEMLPHSDVSLLSCFRALCAQLLLCVLISQLCACNIYETK